MKRLIKSYFTFNKRERNGVLILSFIIVLLLFSNYLLPYVFPPERVDFSTFEQEIDAFKVAQSSYSDSIEKVKRNYKRGFNNKPNPSIIQYFDFDPNQLPEEKWKQLGLKDWQVKVINNYQNKGGKFYKKEDFRKIYGIAPELYASLEPYIIIPDLKKDMPNTFNKNNYTESKTKAGPLIIELNTADTLTLTKLKGIGSVYSQRIIKYRDLLGGFIKMEQLLEIYGMDSVLYKSVSSQSKIDENYIKKININKCTLSDIKKHPYIKHHVAVSIINYREQHGHYKEIQEIKKSHLVNEELYLKLAPYLTVN